MRAVLDTNLVVSYWLTRGETLSRLMAHWEQSHFTYLISPAMLTELKDVVLRPRLRRYMQDDPAILIELIEADAELVPGRITLRGICRDPKDDVFIACAVEGHAAYLVTGDADLLAIDIYQEVRIIRPRTFLQILDR